MANKVLVIHAAAGGGHKRAAEALAREFALADESWECSVIDSLDFTPRAFQLYYRDAYHLMLKKMPWMWANFFALTDSPYMTPRRRSPGIKTTAWLGDKLVKLVEAEKPDVVICTHFLPLEILWLAKKRGRISAPLHCAITDYYAHELWLLPGVDQYYVGNEAIARHIDRWSKGKTTFCVTGIPVSADFRNTRRSPELLARLGLRTGVRTVLLLAGALGMSPITDAYRSICEVAPACQIVIVAGRDQALEDKLRQMSAASSVPTLVLGFVTNIHELMACSDIAITKPGGLTTAECLAMGLVMLFVDPIPGQEERNMEYVLENGAGRRLYHPSDAGCCIRELIAKGNLLETMKQHSSALGRPLASRKVVEITQTCLQSGA